MIPRVGHVVSDALSLSECRCRMTHCRLSSVCRMHPVVGCRVSKALHFHSVKIRNISQNPISGYVVIWQKYESSVNSHQTRIFVLNELQFSLELQLVEITNKMAERHIWAFFSRICLGYFGMWDMFISSIITISYIYF